MVLLMCVCVLMCVCADVVRADERARRGAHCVDAALSGLAANPKRFSAGMLCLCVCVCVCVCECLSVCWCVCVCVSVCERESF